MNKEFDEYLRSLSPDKRKRLRQCVDRAAEILREEEGPFVNAPDVARRVLGEMRIKGKPRASRERIDFATKLICSQLGSRKPRRPRNKPDQYRLGFIE